MGAGYQVRRRDTGDITLSLGDRTVFSYNRQARAQPAGQNEFLRRSGYIHPLFAPAGRLVTDDFSPDHPHQRGIFFAWTKTEIRLDGELLHPDFWNLAAGSARIVSTAAMPSEAGFTAEHSWQARVKEEWREVMRESWSVRAGDPPADPPLPGMAYSFDLESVQKPLVPIDLPQYRYGGMAIRAARQWIDRSAFRFLTSEGKGLEDAEAQPCRWFAMGGIVDEIPVTVALLEHPRNMGAPNPIRLGPAAPYAMFSPPKARSWRLEEGREHRFRFRLVTHNGLPDADLLERHWRNFTGG